MGYPVRLFVYTKVKVQFTILNYINKAVYILLILFYLLAIKGFKVFVIYTPTVSFLTKSLKIKN
jgi:hypothetical protein